MDKLVTLELTKEDLIEAVQDLYRQRYNEQMGGDQLHIPPSIIDIVSTDEENKFVAYCKRELITGCKSHV